MLNIKRSKIFYILISIIIILFDQYTKNLINTNKYSLINKELLFFSIDYAKNYGAAFNLLSGSRVLLSSISIIIATVLSYIIIYRNNLRNIDLLSYSLILGGTVGNGYDRITKGYVIDFINLNFINFPIFNIADISINIGIILIIYCFIRYNK